MDRIEQVKLVEKLRRLFPRNGDILSLCDVVMEGAPLPGQTNEALKPWVGLGISRRTWYRRKALRS